MIGSLDTDHEIKHIVYTAMATVFLLGIGLGLLLGWFIWGVKLGMWWLVGGVVCVVAFVSILAAHKSIGTYLKKYRRD